MIRADLPPFLRLSREERECHSTMSVLLGVVVGACSRIGNMSEPAPEGTAIAELAAIKLYVKNLDAAVEPHDKGHVCRICGKAMSDWSGAPPDDGSESGWVRISLNTGAGYCHSHCCLGENGKT